MRWRKHPKNHNLRSVRRQDCTTQNALQIAASSTAPPVQIKEKSNTHLTQDELRLLNDLVHRLVLRGLGPRTAHGSVDATHCHRNRVTQVLRPQLRSPPH